MKRLFLALLLALASGSAAWAQADTVAVVGSDAILVHQVKEAAERLYGTNAGLEQKKAALEALVAAEVLALEARQRGLDQDPTLRRQLYDVELALLAEYYRQRVLTADIAPDEAAVAARYRQWGNGQQRRLAHILCRDAATAAAILQRLDQGEDFAALARTASEHTESAPSGGDMGYLRRQQVLAPIAAAVWDLPAGSIHPQPLRTRMGYHIVKMLEHRQQSLDEQRPQIVRQLETENKARRQRRLHEALTEKYHLRWNPVVAEKMASRQALPEDQTLFWWRGGRLTAADYLRRSTNPQPVFKDTARLHQAVLKLALEELYRLEALEQGWDRYVQPDLKDKERQLLGQLLFERQVASQEPTAKELQDFYAARRQNYRSRQAVDVREILVKDAALADSLYRLIRQGADMAELARRHTRRADLGPQGGLWRDVPPGNPASAKVYRLASEGQGLLPPVKVPGGYAVIEVLDKRPGRILAYEQVRTVVRQDWQTVRMDQFLAELHHRHASVIRVYADRLTAF